MIIIFNTVPWIFFCFLFFSQVQGFEQVNRLPNTPLEWTNLILVSLLAFIPIFRFVLRRIL